jgi:hypothetical protein
MSEDRRDIKHFVMQHLEDYHKVVVNGTMGTDQIYPHNLGMRSFSPLYNYLAGDEMKELVNRVDRLYKMAQEGLKEQDIGTLVDPFIYFFRADFFNKLALDAIQRDINNPERVHKDDFFDEIRAHNLEQKETIYTYFSNLRIVMEMMFGDQWQISQSGVINLFNSYTHHWELNQRFIEMEKVRV